MQTDTASVETRHVYSTSLRNPSYLRYQIGMWLTMFVVYFALQVPSHSWLDALISGIVFTTFMFAFFVLTRIQRVQLTVTPEAFEYGTSGRRYWAYWSQVESLKRSSPLGMLLWGRESLRLPRKPYIRIGTRHFGWWRGFVPLEWFAPDWRHSPLGDDIRRYAPWLWEG